MPDFYTSAIIRGDNILYRGYKDGKRTSARVPFRPKIYLLSQNRDAEWKTLDGRAVEEFYAGTIRETKEFIETHSDISNFEVFGNTDFQYQYLAEEFPNEVDYDPSLLQVCYLDIETECEDGFPSIENADQRINLITLRVPSKKEKNKFVTYSFCVHDKEDLLQRYFSSTMNLKCLNSLFNLGSISCQTLLQDGMFNSLIFHILFIELIKFLATEQQIFYLLGKSSKIEKCLLKIVIKNK
jgi:hypothetical protein